MIISCPKPKQAEANAACEQQREGGQMTTAQKAYWRDNALKIALLLFGAGVAWGAVQLSQSQILERLDDNGLILRDHEERITDLEVCAAEQAVTSAAILEQMRQLNVNVQSINEFLREMGSR